MSCETHSKYIYGNFCIARITVDIPQALNFKYGSSPEKLIHIICNHTPSKRVKGANSIMKVIDMAAWPRRSQFDFFKQLQKHIDNTDEWIFLSCLPWMRFTSLTNPNGGPNDCIPRISWGKLDNQGSRWTIPVAVQVHHALVDGVHVGKFYEALAESIATGLEKGPRVIQGLEGGREP